MTVAALQQASAVVAPAEAAYLPIAYGPAVNVSDGGGISQESLVSVDAAGNVYVAWEDRSVELMLLARSFDGGSTFTAPSAIAPGDEYLSFGQVRMASLGPADLRVAMTVFDTFYGGAEIAYAASYDAGASFPDLGLVSIIDQYNSYGSDIAAGWGIAMVWGDNDVSTGKTRIELSVSEDEGASFTYPKRLDSALTFAQCSAVGMSGDAAVYAAWVQNDHPFGDDEGSEIFFTRSTDKGGTFSDPVNISNNNDKSWCPRLVVDELGTIYLLWTEGPAFEDRRLLLAVSTDGGLSFGAPVVIAGPVGFMEASIAASGDGALWIAWMVMDDGFNFESFVVRSLDRGQSFSPPMFLPGGYRIASTARDEIFVSWNETPPGRDWDDVFVAAGHILVCGDADNNGQLLASDALAALLGGVGAASCPACRCDADGSGKVLASDALAILRAAVGYPLPVGCPAC